MYTCKDTSRLKAELLYTFARVVAGHAALETRNNLLTREPVSHGWFCPASGAENAFACFALAGAARRGFQGPGCDNGHQPRAHPLFHPHCAFLVLIAQNQNSQSSPYSSTSGYVVEGMPDLLQSI